MSPSEDCCSKLRWHCQVRYIKEMAVYVCTASWSVFAYIWLIIILLVISPNVVEAFLGIGLWGTAFAETAKESGELPNPMDVSLLMAHLCGLSDSYHHACFLWGRRAPDLDVRGHFVAGGWRSYPCRVPRTPRSSWPLFAPSRNLPLCWCMTSRFAQDVARCRICGAAAGDFQAEDVACHLFRSLLQGRPGPGAQPAPEWLDRHASQTGPPRGSAGPQPRTSSKQGRRSYSAIRRSAGRWFPRGWGCLCCATVSRGASARPSF